MSNYDMKIHSNPDAQAWAKFFIQTKEEKSLRIEDIDESLMLAWFANAMMAMHDHLESQRTWVDLTNEDWNEIFDTALNKVEAIKLTKAKLKQKNGYAEEKNT